MFKKHIFLLLIPVCLSPILFNYFESFPNGWDQTEYTCCIQYDYLPHSPYIGHFLMGKAFNTFLNPAAALSAISLLSGLASLVLLYFLNLGLLKRCCPTQTLDRPNTRALLLLPVILLGFSYPFIRQSTTQELYVFQTMLLLLSLNLLFIKSKARWILSGLVYGYAISTHTASILILPAIIYTLKLANRERWGRALVGWLSAAAGAAVVFLGIIYLLIPLGEEDGSFGRYLHYLMGIHPGISLEQLSAPAFWHESLTGLFNRLMNDSLIHSRQPEAVSPLCLSIPHMLLAAVGLVVSWRQRRRFSIFWLLYLTPYLAFEILLGKNLDYGLYIPFILIPLFTFISIPLMFINRRDGSHYSPKLLLPIYLMITILLLTPSIAFIRSHWNDARDDAINHFSPTTLAAKWVSNNLPDNAVVIQSSWEWNALILPYYANRRSILWKLQPEARRAYGILKGRVKYMPLNEASFEVLSTETLKRLILHKIPVYAFEADPFSFSDPEMIDRAAFQFEPWTEVELKPLLAGLPLPASAKEELKGQRAKLFRMSLATSR